MISAETAEIAVIIVNYSTAELAIEAIESVLSRRHGGRTIEVFLVDNASPSHDAKILESASEAQSWDGRVTILAEPENHGFGRGNNIVLQNLAARTNPPRYAFLLNPDARLENEALSELANFLDAHPHAAAAGASISKPDGTAVPAAFRFPGIASTFAESLNFGPVTRLLSRYNVPLPPETPTSRVDWVAGAAVMIRLSAAQEVGFFDPAYFLYYEEVDLMLQMTRRGGEIWYVTEARAIHVEGASTGVKSGETVRRRRPAYWYQSWKHYFSKNHGRTWAIVAALVWIVGAAGNELVSLLRQRPPAVPLRFFRDFWAITLRPLLGL